MLTCCTFLSDLEWWRLWSYGGLCWLSKALSRSWLFAQWFVLISFELLGHRNVGLLSWYLQLIDNFQNYVVNFVPYFRHARYPYSTAPAVHFTIINHLFEEFVFLLKWGSLSFEWFKHMMYLNYEYIPWPLMLCAEYQDQRSSVVEAHD